MTDPGVAFVATRAEVEALVASGTRFTELIALAPEAADAAEADSLPYRPIHALYSESELLDRAAPYGRQAERLAEVVDAALGIESGEGVWPLFSATQFLYFLKIMLDASFHRAFTLRRSLMELGPPRILCFAPAHHPVTDELWFHPDALAHSTLPIVAAGLGVECRVLKRPRTPTAHPLPKLERALRSARHWRYRSRPRPERGRPTAVVPMAFPDEVVTEACLEQGMDVVPLRMRRIDGRESPWSSAELARAWTRLAAGEEVRAATTIDEIELWPFVRPRLERFVRNLPARHAARVVAAERILSKQATPIVLGAYRASTASIAPLVAAHRLGVPVAIYQHGGFIGYFEWPMLRYTDLWFADAYLCYGTGVADYALELSDGAGPTSYAIGSAALDQILTRVERSRAPGPVRVLYAPTNLAGESRHFSGSHSADTLQFELQKRVVRACREAGADIVVKAAADDVPNPLEDWIRRSGITASVVRSGTFVDQLDRADLAVLDVPTTTLLQALQARVPVVALADSSYTRLRPGALALLRRMATVATDRDGFVELVRRAASEPAPVGTDASFLREYGTGEGDGRAASRAAEIVAALARPGSLGAAEEPVSSGPGRWHRGDEER